MGPEFLRLYDEALPHVYGYFLRRCDGPDVAEDLTAETFLAALDTVVRGSRTEPTLPWIIGVARHKLVDHWRREGRAERNLQVMGVQAGAFADAEDPWEERLDAVLAQATLDDLPTHYRGALTLRYLDDLPVPEVASALGLGVHATEGLLVRARAAFRRAYPSREHDDA